MIEEKNIHARNVKIISILFILYWVLELQPSSDNLIRLSFINYEIHNPELLPWVANVALIYFGWRFWLATRKVIGFRSQYQMFLRKRLGAEEFMSCKHSSELMARAQKNVENFFQNDAVDWLRENYSNLSEEERDRLIDSKWEITALNLASNTTKNLVATVEIDYVAKGNQKMKTFVTLKISWYMFLWSKISSFILTVSTSEHFAAHSLSWILFSLGVASSVLLRLGL